MQKFEDSRPRPLNLRILEWAISVCGMGSHRSTPIIARMQLNNEDARPGVGIGTMTSRDKGSEDRTQGYIHQNSDVMPSVINEMKARGAVLTHVGIMFLVRLPPELGPRLGIRALSRHSESYFTYAFGTSRESRKNHPMAHLYVGDEDEPEVFREKEGRRLQALQNLNQLPTPTEREEWLLVIHDRLLAARRVYSQSASAKTKRKAYMARDGVAEQTSETLAAWVATDHGKALEKEAHDRSNAITTKARATGKRWGKSPWADPTEDDLDEIALADYLKWVDNNGRSAQKLNEASSKTLQQFKADKIAEFRATRVAEVEDTAAAAADSERFFKKANAHFGKG
ncbi:hypothetical protein H2200_012691 [Cladophialophora chaetospira]|uniref:Uncharacterized protein n=1 Tax=Cladophialophora chaetospira TaxID=386627 RepID=A0AA38WXF5_9EURO|nr:hypothetical protein H2200_012691 [Cladophialophora chaetospira]